MTALTELSAVEMARHIRVGELSSAEIVEAHIARIEAVNPRLNAMVVQLFDQARQEAAAADQATRQGRSFGPLHGVPMTIKEQFLLKDTPTTFGLPRLQGHKATEDGPLVKRLRDAGGIVLGKTNVAQLLFYVESDNRVYGRSNNPWDLERTCGGSTGGEAALIAAGGSPLGIGGDIGGSIREPAHFCGIHGFKPTSGRLTNFDTRGGIFPGGQAAILPQPGPMARSVADLVLSMSILAAPGLERLDPAIPPVAWRDPAEVDVSKLRIAMYTDDGYFPASPAVRRVVEEAANALRACGAQVDRWSPPDVGEAMRLFFSILTADGMESMWRALGPDLPEPQLSLFLDVARLTPDERRTSAAALFGDGQRHMANFRMNVAPRSADEYWKLVEDQSAYRQRFLAGLDQGGFDAIICPPAAVPALPHGATEKLPDYDSYSRVFNVLGLPAGVVAAGRVRPDEESDRPASTDKVEQMAAVVEKGSAGLPVTVQVASRHWQEDVALAVMSALEQHFRAHSDYPARPPI